MKAVLRYLWRSCRGRPFSNRGAAVVRGVSVLLVGLWTASCVNAPKNPASDADTTAHAGGAPGLTRLRGVLLGTPQPKPDFTLTTLDGKPFDFRRDTEGRLTLLFFGYTYCPDICPIHMANVGKVLNGLPNDVARQVNLVFVTTDPERDTPERLRAWLGNFHPGFIGLTGTPEAIEQAQRATSLIPAVRDTPDTANPGAYYIGHAAQVIAFTSDGLAHIVYPFGIRQHDWANDLPILVNGWPQ